MAQRLAERFTVDQLVEIYFEQIDAWVYGEVVRFDAPGVWVRTLVDGRLWFVTNGRRIRAHQSDEQIAEEDDDAARGD